ncbi:MAG: LuxR C-terminal-related transcriptional regulator [Actinomycetota bacterium]
MSLPRVVIVDDHAIARAGTRALLGDRVEVVGEAGTVAEAIEVIRDTMPDLVLLDLRMPGGGGSAVMEAVAPLGVRVLVVSASSRRSDVRDLVRAGAVGYLTKGVREDEFADQVVAAAAGQAVFSREFAAWLNEVVEAAADDGDMAGLTSRELEIVAHVSEGRSNKEIARQAAISVKTVEAHLASIFSKLGVSNRREVMNWARERGMEEERPELTESQRRVLGLIARGLRNVEIAGRLGTTTAAVEAEVRGILEAVQALDPR